MERQALSVQCVWEQCSQPWGRDDGHHGHCWLNLDSFVLKGRSPDRFRASHASKNCLMTEAGKARGLSAIPMGLGKGVLEKHVLSFFQSHKGHCWERTVEWQCARQPWLSQSGDAKPLHLSFIL